MAEADYLAGNMEAALRALEVLPNPTPDADRLLALCRVREVLTHWTADTPFDAVRARAALAESADNARLEADRLFALGWLHWLAGEPEAADGLLTQAVTRFGEVGAAAQRVEAAYWSARVGLHRNRADAVAGFERTLRQGGAPPRATCWFVDLLWRAGQLDRAEQVWKTVRTNRKVTVADEAPLLEARGLLRRGEFGQAERALGEASPQGGVAQVERDLLLGWALAAQNQAAHASSLLGQAEAASYPRAALAAWRILFEARQGATVASLPAPPPLTTYLAGQHARMASRLNEATASLREALTSQPAQPFARYALACLGHADFAAVLEGQPGWFLALRCRARLAVERFRARQATSAELLDQLDRAAAAGFRLPSDAHWRRLADVLGRPGITAGELQALAQPDPSPSDEGLRDRLIAAVATAARRLAPQAALTLLADWARLDVVRQDGPLRDALGHHLLQSLLKASIDSGQPRETAEEHLAAAVSLLDGGPRVTLTRALLGMTEKPGISGAADAETAPLLALWQAALAVAKRAAPQQSPDARALLPEPLPSGRLRGLARALLLQDAAQRGDATAAAGILQDSDAWRAFPSGPPRFALTALGHLVKTHPADPRLRTALAGWLALWGLGRLPPEADALAVHAGLAALDPKTANPPEGTPSVRWLLHQAAQAVGRKRFAEALAWTRRALAHDPELASVPEKAAVEAALPELEVLARADQLAAVTRFVADQPPAPAELLVDAVVLLDADPQGKAVLEAAAAGDVEQARRGLANLARRADLEPRLAHHLALLYHRAALHLEGRDQGEAADALWLSAWHCWLRVLAALAPGEFDAAANGGPGKGRLLLGWLLGAHRARLGDLLAQGKMERARRHWDAVHALPGTARLHSEDLAQRLDAALTPFRNELATAYLTATHEAMRHGEVRSGWRADYDRGLGALRRLLSLDRDNVRLLTALVDSCSEWFFDCYNNEDGPGLREGVNRFTPFALKLARLVEGRPAELAARAALAEFYKYRGFIAPERAAKVALYREALRFNPANRNVGDLLAELQPPEEQS